MNLYRFRRAENWGGEKKGTDWTTWGLVRCRSSTAAAAERHVGWILHSRESIEPINVPTLQVNQLLQINEDTIKPSLAAQDINPRQLASEHTYLT